MRPGPLEIIVIIVVIIAAAVLTRIFRTNHGSAQQKRGSSADTQTKPTEVRPSKIRNFLKRIGLACTLTGIILLLAGISIFRWAFQSYLWSLIIIATGMVLTVLSRQK